jgi:aspartate/methionine/tyrosine aminotransferase
MTLVARSLQPFGTTIFTTMSRLALEHGAVNLAQGFPDFEGPDFVKDAAAAAMKREHNQYAPMPGLPALRQEIARRWERSSGLPANPETNVTVTAGCTEAIAAAIFGICNPGDEVILFEPYYDSYRACVAMAGAVPRFVALAPAQSEGAGGRSTFNFDEAQLRAAFTARTRAILVNTPHNPTGKVFTRAELELIARLCVEHDCLAIVDEVYERLVFDPAMLPHIHLATLPGMADRTITLSSLGKTFSLTGWKIGWAIAPPPLTAAIRAAHQFLTFAVATPLQWGAVEALRREDEYVPLLLADLRGNKENLAAALRDIGFTVHAPAGTYFILADHTPISSRLGLKDDASFCQYLIEKIGVAAIPPSVFYEHAELGRSLVRFAFCKKIDTMREGIARLRKLRA